MKLFSRQDMQNIPCPLCNTRNSNTIIRGDRYNMGLHTVCCHTCGLIHLNPRPNQDALDRFYKYSYRDYYQQTRTPTQEHLARQTYLKRAKHAINLLSQHADVGNTKTVLDIGCGEGTLLSELLQTCPNANAVGIEPHTQFAAFANNHSGATVFNGSWEQYFGRNPQHRPADFDIITACHVLEHIVNPTDFLNCIRDHLSPKSLLYIEVPNILDDRVHGIGNVHIGHVVSYDPSTLKLLAETCGLSVIQLHTKNLPAITPSMAAICRRTDHRITKPAVSSHSIQEKEGFLQARIKAPKRPPLPIRIARQIRQRFSRGGTA